MGMSAGCTDIDTINRWVEEFVAFGGYVRSKGKLVDAYSLDPEVRQELVDSVGKTSNLRLNINKETCLIELMDGTHEPINLKYLVLNLDPPKPLRAPLGAGKK